MTRDTVYKHLRKVFALPFLPPDDINEAFKELKAKSTEVHQIEEFMIYVENNWMYNKTYVGCREH